MKHGKLAVIAIVAGFMSCVEKRIAQDITPAQAKELTKEAYIYAFPAVEHNKAIWKISVANQRSWNTMPDHFGLFSLNDTTVVSPNNDTYYAPFILDIRDEPVVFTIPKVDGSRYFCMQLIDVFTNSPEYISTLATGQGPGNYIVASSNWDGAIPKGIDKVIKIPATVALVIGRLQVYGDEDTVAANLIKQFDVKSLSLFTKAPPKNIETLQWTAVPYDSRTGDIEGFLNMFNYMVQYQILNENDKAMLAKFAPLNIGADKTFKKDDFSEKVWAAIEDGATEAKELIEKKSVSIGKKINNWDYSPQNAGRWGKDYITNAAAAWRYIYVNTPEEAIYPTTNVDEEGDYLNGAKHNYTITFTKDQIPQVKFFWSMTVYNDRGFFQENMLNRYNINSNSRTTYGDDGSLTLYMQHENPGKSKETNWLPVPEGGFYVILRMYGPSKEAVEGQFVIPAIAKTIN